MNFPDLKSKRLILEKLSEDGLQDMHEYSVMPQVYTYLEFPPHETLEGTKLYLKKLLERSKSENAHYWFIKLTEINKIIGTFGIHDIDWRKRIGEVSYGVSPAYSRQGLFSEALATVLTYVFQQLDFHRICATTRSDNIGSIKGLKRNGFIVEGTFRDFYLSHEGNRFDALSLSILKEEFLEE